MAKQVFQDLEFHDNDITGLKKLTLTQDATAPGDAATLGQTQADAASAVQSAIVSQTSAASATTTFSSEHTKQSLNTKQPTMAIAPGSTSLLEIVDGYMLKLKDLGIVKGIKDTLHTDLDDLLAVANFAGDGTFTADIDGTGVQTVDAMTFIGFDLATEPQDKAQLYLGTPFDDVRSFMNFSVTYNVPLIRGMFDVGFGLLYDVGTGLTDLNLGTGVDQLGAHSLPVNTTGFLNNYNAEEVQSFLIEFETLIINTFDEMVARMDSRDSHTDALVGSVLAHLGDFAGTLFQSNKSVKQILQQSEATHEAATADRAAIRSEATTQSTAINNALASEADTREAADVAESGRAVAAETTLQQNINGVNQSLASALSAMNSADEALDDRLDVVEGFGAGSISKAQEDAAGYTDAEVLVEKGRAMAAEATIIDTMNNLQKGDLKYIGSIGADGLLALTTPMINASDPRNGQPFVDVAFTAGEQVSTTDDVTLAFGDGTEWIFDPGDVITAIDDIIAGAATKAKFNGLQGSSTAITQANIDGARIEKTALGMLDIVGESIGLPQLSAAVKADLNDKRSSTSPNIITSDGDTHHVTSTELGAQQNIYHQRTQASSEALTGTARTLLAELLVNTNGSGNPAAPSFAHVETIAAHYQGGCTDLSLFMAGANFESNAAQGTAIQATGLYASAVADQLGNNVGGIFTAENAANSNIGSFSYSDMSSVGNNRGSISALSTLTLAQYSGARAVNPLPYDSVAMTADAEYAGPGGLAFHAIGNSVFDGPVHVPASSDDDHAVNAGELKDKQRAYKVNTTSGQSKVISNTGLDLTKVIWQITDNGEAVGVDVVLDAAADTITITASGGNLTDVTILVHEIIVDVVSV